MRLFFEVAKDGQMALGDGLPLQVCVKAIGG
jgi:hypothetical protein